MPNPRARPWGSASAIFAKERAARVNWAVDSCPSVDFLKGATMSGAEGAPGQPEAAAPSSAVVPAPATDGAVDLTVHPSGIVPQLQCVPPLPPTSLVSLSFLEILRARVRTAD